MRVPVDWSKQEARCALTVSKDRGGIKRLIVMKIERQEKSAQESAEIRAELSKVASPPAKTERVCDPSCDAVCSTCGVTNCLCACFNGCPHIPSVLTSDPNFPIESKIAALAFELKRLEVFKPCWSCEGHNDRTGALWKVPRVWFYCDSVLHVRLLADALKDLEIDKLISGPWQVRLTFSDENNPDTTFSLEPVTERGSGTTLAALQQDVMVIVDKLNPMMVEKAGALLSNA